MTALTVDPVFSEAVTTDNRDLAETVKFQEARIEALRHALAAAEIEKAELLARAVLAEQKRDQHAEYIEMLLRREERLR